MFVTTGRPTPHAHAHAHAHALTAAAATATTATTATSATAANAISFATATTTIITSTTIISTTTAVHHPLSTPTTTAATTTSGRLFKRLWAAGIGAQAKFELPSPVWEKMGFQQVDPRTDVRGGGTLSLQQLVFFAERCEYMHDAAA